MQPFLQTRRMMHTWFVFINHFIFTYNSKTNSLRVMEQGLNDTEFSLLRQSDNQFQVLKFFLSCLNGNKHCLTNKAIKETGKQKMRSKNDNFKARSGWGRMNQVVRKRFKRKLRKKNSTPKCWLCSMALSTEYARIICCSNKDTRVQIMHLFWHFAEMLKSPVHWEASNEWSHPSQSCTHLLCSFQ